MREIWQVRCSGWRIYSGKSQPSDLIRTDGTVVSDSDADPAELDNHLSRKEVVQAMKKAVALRNVIPTH